MSLRSPAPSMRVVAMRGSLDRREGFRSVSRSTSSFRAATRSSLGGCMQLLASCTPFLVLQRTPFSYWAISSLRILSYWPFLRKVCTKASIADRFVWERGSSEGRNFLRTGTDASPSSARLRTSAMDERRGRELSSCSVVDYALRPVHAGDGDARVWSRASGNE